MPPATRPHVVHQAGAQHLDALRAAYARRGVDGRVRRVHRRHGGALRVGRPRHLPRRRDRRSPSSPRSACGAIIVPLPGAIADEQTRQRAVPRRRRRGACASRRTQLDAGAARGAARRARRARRRWRWRSPRARWARSDAADRVADACVALGARAMKHKVKRVHFVGIGGAGMSGIAEVLRNQGYQVSGSDLARQRGDAAPAPASASTIAIGHARGERRRRRRGRRVDRGRAPTTPKSSRARERAYRSCRAR